MTTTNRPVLHSLVRQPAPKQRGDRATDQLTADEQRHALRRDFANVSVIARAIVTAGLANDVEEVNQ